LTSYIINAVFFDTQTMKQFTVPEMTF